MPNQRPVGVWLLALIGVFGSAALIDWAYVAVSLVPESAAAERELVDARARLDAQLDRDAELRDFSWVETDAITVKRRITQRLLDADSEAFSVHVARRNRLREHAVVATGLALTTSLLSIVASRQKPKGLVVFGVMLVALSGALWTSLYLGGHV